MSPSEKKTFHLLNILILLPKVDDGFGGSVTLPVHTEPDVRRTSSCWDIDNFLGFLNILQCCFHLLIFINK